MAGGVYSERFINYVGPAATSTYAVPLGKRAIVKNVFSYNGDGVARNLAIAVAGKGVWVTPVPGGNGQVSVDLFIVLYAGELLQLITYGAQQSAGASGYLLADPR